ncbi:MAG: rod shape-determining protein MreC [Fimbriimonadaceae bacterium]|nr:rod shape-determining protein MreC [Fimbriimonadaceae bacterium]
MRKRESFPWLDALLILLGLVLAGWGDRTQAAARTENRLDPISNGTQMLVSPVAGLARRIQVGTSDFGIGVFRGGELIRENERLRAMEASMVLYQESAGRYEAELQSLRKLMGLPSTPGRSGIAADIIGAFPAQSRITLSIGRRSGVKAGMAVISPDGLLGVVQTVEDGRCQVLLLTSPASKVGAMDVNRNPPSTGLLQGVNAGLVTLTLFDPKAPVQVGDRIVTSGYGERIPRGLIVGQVIQVEDSPSEGLRRAMILPAASLGTTREVKVLP